MPRRILDLRFFLADDSSTKLHNQNTNTNTMMMTMKSRATSRFLVVALQVASLMCTSHAFVAPASHVSLQRRASTPSSPLVSLASSSSSKTDHDVLDSLTPELAKITNAFKTIGDDRLRHKQLLYMAGQLAPMDATLKTPANQVPGCLSTVHVEAIPVTEQPSSSGDDDDDASSNEPRIQFVGDSDGLLTKGLLALLVRGLNGCTPSEIQKVDPKFIQVAGIQASLTPGRNNGFLNMLAVMKKKAMQAGNDENVKENDDDDDDDEDDSTTPAEDAPITKYDAIIQTLQALQPTKLALTDVSHRHAGHAHMMDNVPGKAGGGDGGGETHFELGIVADAFDGLNLVKRHRLVYMMLGEIMPAIHALQIKASTPKEEEEEEETSSPSS